jgi:hypothetical protein
MMDYTYVGPNSAVDVCGTGDGCVASCHHCPWCRRFPTWAAAATAAVGHTDEAHPDTEVS